MAKSAQPKDPEGRQYRFEVDVTWQAPVRVQGQGKVGTEPRRATVRNNSYGASARVYYSIGPVKGAITKIKQRYQDMDPHATFDVRVYYVDLADWHIREDISGTTHVIQENDFMDDLRGTLLDR